MTNQIRGRKTSLCDKMVLPNFGTRTTATDFSQSYKYTAPHQVYSLIEINKANQLSNKGGSIHSAAPKFYPSKSRDGEKLNINVFNSDKNIGENKVIEVSKIQNISLQNALYILDKSIAQCAIFHRTFGYSNFQISNCLISPEGKLILTQRCPTLGGDHISDETIVVMKIIDAVKKICAPKVFNDFHAYFKRNQAKTKCDFKYMHSLIRSYCICSKIKLGQKIETSQISDGSSFRINIFKSSERAVSSIEQSKSLINRRRFTIEEFEKKNINIFLSTYKSQNKLLQQNKLKPLKKSANISDDRKSLQTKMTKSNEISMQFNLKINANDEETTKDNLSSTYNKSTQIQQSSRGDCVELSITFCDKFGTILSQNINRANSCEKTADMPFFAQNLQQTESTSSQQEISQYHPSVELRRRSYEPPTTPKDELILQKQTQQLIFENNNWTRRVDNLFISNAPMIESFMQGKQEQPNCGPNPEHLGKLARVVVESFLPPAGSRKQVQN